MPRLVITKGSGIGRDHAVTTECVVGRGADVDFVLEDGNTSRRHCRVLLDGTGYAMEDLGSRNGTFVNGTRIQRHALTDGDVVRIGGTEFVFRQMGLIAPSTASAARAIAVPPAISVPRAVAVPPIVARPAAVATAPPARAAPPPSPDAAPLSKPFVAPISSKKRRSNW